MDDVYSEPEPLPPPQPQQQRQQQQQQQQLQAQGVDLERPGTFPGQFKCHQCGKVYRWKGNLQTHLRIECGKPPQLQCPFCPQRFKHKSHLKRHMLCRHKYAP